MKSVWATNILYDILNEIEEKGDYENGIIQSSLGEWPREGDLVSLHD